MTELLLAILSNERVKFDGILPRLVARTYAGIIHGLIWGPRGHEAPRADQGVRNGSECLLISNNRHLPSDNRHCHLGKDAMCFESHVPECQNTEPVSLIVALVK